MPDIAEPPASVAVLIPAKDASATIGRAVRSALSQPEALEVIVIDDGSSDGTADVARSCDDGSGRLTVLRQANLGPSAARNAGIEASAAPLLCGLDSDDVFCPGRLATILAAAGDDWDFAADRLLIGQEGSEDGPYERWRAGDPLPEHLDFKTFIEGNISQAARPRVELGYLKPIMRRAFLDEHRLRFREDVWLGEDYVLYAAALAQGARFRIVDHYGYVAIDRPCSLSHVHPAESLGALLRADLALDVPSLAPAERRALRRHQAGLRRKWLYRLALDAKKRGRIPQAACLAFSSPDVFAYMVAQTLRAWGASVPGAPH